MLTEFAKARTGRENDAEVLPPPRAARAAEPGFDFYEAQAKKLLKGAGVKLWEVADEARKCGFHQFAIEQAQRSTRRGGFRQHVRLPGKCAPTGWEPERGIVSLSIG